MAALNASFLDGGRRLLITFDQGADLLLGILQFRDRFQKQTGGDNFQMAASTSWSNPSLIFITSFG
jgi:hypothetical protein